MSDVSEALLELFVTACGEEHRAPLERVVSDSRQARVRAAVLAQELHSRRADAIAELRRVHTQRFGAVSSARMDRLVPALDARALELAALLVDGSTGAEELASRLDLLERVCLEERRRGAATVLSRMLEGRFGMPMEYAYDDVCRLAHATDLDGCFARLESATSADEVLGPLLRRLERQSDE